MGSTSPVDDKLSRRVCVPKPTMARMECVDEALYRAVRILQPAMARIGAKSAGVSRQQLGPRPPSSLPSPPSAPIYPPMPAGFIAMGAYITPSHMPMEQQRGVQPPTLYLPVPQSVMPRGFVAQAAQATIPKELCATPCFVPMHVPMEQGREGGGGGVGGVGGQGGQEGERWWDGEVGQILQNMRIDTDRARQVYHQQPEVNYLPRFRLRLIPLNGKC